MFSPQLQCLILALFYANLGLLSASPRPLIPLDSRSDHNETGLQTMLKPSTLVRNTENVTSEAISDADEHDDRDHVGDRMGEPMRLAPLLGSPMDAYKPNTYIILMKENATMVHYVSKLKSMIDSGTSPSGAESKIGYVYPDSLLNGFSALLVGTAFDFVARSPEVSCFFFSFS